MANKQAMRIEIIEQAEQIGAMHTTIQCMADTLMERDEQIEKLTVDNLMQEAKINRYEAQLIQANFDIVRLEERNASLHEDYDVMLEVISEQDAEITTLKTNQSKFSG